MVKKIMQISIIVIAIILSLTITISLFATIILASPWLAMYTYMFFQPNPPKPEITYGEFPFELVYEIDGEIVTVNDVYVCEFDGFSMNTGRMEKYRTWKGYVKSTEQNNVVLLHDGDLKIVCYVGNPEYYMSDPEYKGDHPYKLNILKQICYSFGTSTSGVPEEIDKLMQQYKIRIVSWQFSEPIENSYK